MQRKIFASVPGDLRHVVLSAAALLALVLTSATSLAQTYDFNAGNDTGFTRYSPLAPYGAGGTFSFPTGGYRIEAPSSPAPGLAGPGRAGSFVNGNSYTDFTTSVDLVDWDNALDQAFGILSRTTNIGLGTTNGYAFTYATDGPSIDISKVTGEQASNLGSADVALDPSRDYRLVFQGVGNTLTGTVYDLADLTTPLATATANDATYASGVNGVFVFDNSATKDQPADATFDNLSGTNQVPEPAALSVLALAALGLTTRRHRA
jgi:hypothetical protein